MSERASSACHDAGVTERVLRSREAEQLHSALSRTARSAPHAVTPCRAATPLCDARSIGLGLYAEAERLLSAAKALYRYDMFEQGDVAVTAVTEIEAEEREARLAAGAKLALDLEHAMRSVEAHAGGGWFSDSKRDRVRALARRVRADLPTLEQRALSPSAPSLPPAGALSVSRADARQATKRSS